MIKVKILNPISDRNEPTFRPLFFVKDMLRDYSIDITDSDDYDYLFVGMYDFIYKHKSLPESIDDGLENLSKITGDYFLFDGSDSTSLMGAYEVFKYSDAKYLFKNQLLNREDYKIPTAFNKWFFGNGSDLDLSYDIPIEDWNRIKLSGWNLGYLLPHYGDFFPISNTKNLDVCAIYQANHDYSEDHGVQNNNYYTKHRKGVWEILSDKYNSTKDRLPYEEYIKILRNSKVAISPFGMGELCFRDFECMKFGTVVIKPNMEKINTFPNIYLGNETYLSVNYDWKNLNEVIDNFLDNFKELNEKINENLRNLFHREYTHENLCMYWYNIFKNLDNTGVE